MINKIARPSETLKLKKPGRDWALNRWLGKYLATMSLSHVSRVCEGGAVFYHKRRHPYTEALIWIANILLRPRLVVLPQRRWLRWETDCYRQFYDWEVRPQAGGLSLPEISGLTLVNLIRATPEASLRLKAIAAAIQALRQLHETRVRFPNGVESFFSHGDASARNVIYDMTTRTACWFDFETVHPNGYPPHWRQADDLRAFTYSVAALLPAYELSNLADTLATHYPEPTILGELIRLSRQLEQWPDPFHLSQTQIDLPQSELWSLALQHALKQLHLKER